MQEPSSAPWFPPPGPLNLRLRVGERGRVAALDQLRRSYTAGLIDAGTYDRLMHQIILCQSRPALEGILAHARVQELGQRPQLRIAQARRQEVQAQALADYIRHQMYEAHADEAISLQELDMANQQLLSTRGSLPRLWKIYEQLGVPYEPPAPTWRVRLARWARWWAPIAWAAFLCSWLATAVSWPWHHLTTLHIALVAARDTTGVVAVALGAYYLLEADTAEVSNTEGMLDRDLVLMQHPRRRRHLRWMAVAAVAVSAAVVTMYAAGAGNWLG
jgi:hypothetical protein